MLFKTFFSLASDSANFMYTSTEQIPGRIKEIPLEQILTRQRIDDNHFVVFRWAFYTKICKDVKQLCFWSAWNVWLRITHSVVEKKDKVVKA